MNIIRMGKTVAPSIIASRCVIHEGMVYLGGLNAASVGPSMEVQTKAVLAQVDAWLLRAGSERSLIITVQIWLADMSQFSAMNSAWNSWVDMEHPPLRACVQAQLAEPGALLEIMVTAAIRR